MIIKHVCNFILFIFISGVAIAADLKVFPTGIYTDIYFNEEAGDLLGVEIFLLRGGDEYYVLFQSAEGIPGKPVVVPAVD